MEKENKVLNALISILLIISMTFANLILLGNSIVNAVYENLETQSNTTTEGNIEFDAYFKNDKDKVHSKEINIYEGETLYIRVNVKNKVSISNATITIENANLQIKGNEDDIKTKNKYMQNINKEKNEIELTSISSNNDAILEIPIEFKKESEIKEDTFSREINIKISGAYKNESGKENKLEGKVIVAPIWTSKAEMEMTQSIDKYFSLGQLGLVLQEKITTDVVNNVLPRKDEKIEIEVANLDGNKPENVTVLINGNKIEEEEYVYDKEKGTLEIKKENITTWNEEKYEYTIIYKYAGTVSDAKRSIKLKAKETTQLYTQIDKIEKEEEKEVEVEKAGNVASIETTLSGEIYKGYAYAESEKEATYEETNKIEVSYTQDISQITVDTNEEKFANQANEDVADATISIRYITTIINKEEMLKILGENGSIQILDENKNVITSIDKNSEENNGKVEVNYNQEYQKIIIQTSKPEKEGIITINNKKALKGKTGYSAKELKTYNAIKITGNVITNISQESSNSQIEIKEPTTEAKIEIDRNDLSTIKTNKNVEIKATLKSNDMRYDLYKNPTVEIQMPQDIEKVNVNNISIMNGDEFVAKPSQGVVDGKQVIKITLEGEQKEYKEIGVDGTTIIINADLILNNKATSKQDNITMIYTNEKANKYEEGSTIGNEVSPIEIVSPKGLIATNNIKELGIETIGEEKLTSQKLDKSAPEKQLAVNQEVINNNDNKIENIEILGTFGTNGKSTINEEQKENNIGEFLTTGLSINSEDSSKIKVYYSENGNATSDINNKENGWSEQITDANKTKKYLVTVASMENGESLSIGYNAQIPANLEYNQQSYQGYETTYTESLTKTQQKVSATTIQTTTGAGPVVNAELKAMVGNEDVTTGSNVKEGEVIKYIVTVKNTGSEDASNVAITGNVPDGTVLVQPKDNFNYQEQYYDELKDTTKKLSIETIGVGETKEVSYEVRVNQGITENSKITNICTYKYGEVSKQTNEFSNTLIGGKLRLTTKRVTDSSSEIYSGGSIVYQVLIENTSTEDLSGVKLKLNLPEIAEANTLTLNEKNESYSESDAQEINGVKVYPEGKGPYITTVLENQDELNLGDFSAGNKKWINIPINIKEVQKDTNMTVSAVGSNNKDTYRSNEVSDNVIGISIDGNIKIDNTDNLKSGNTFKYTITLKNNSAITMDRINIIDKIPFDLTIQKIEVNGEERSVDSVYDKQVNLNEKIEANGELKIEITCEVTQDLSRTSAKTISNFATYTVFTGKQYSTNTITSIILADSKASTSTDNQQNNNTNQANSNTNTNLISGVAWKDENKNGKKEDSEGLLSGITVQLLNVNTNEFEKNSNGEKISTTTNDKGVYILSNIPDGDYLAIFGYDTSRYKITTYHASGTDDINNSDAIEKELSIDGNTTKYGATEKISANKSNFSNINIGLIEANKFDISLKKYINKVIVQNSSGTQVYQYNNTDFAKIEINAKRINNSNVIIEYNIVATNNGELEGYVKNVIDYMPNDLKFSSEMNSDWYQKDNNLYNNTLANEIIKPGESKTLKLTLTKKMTDKNTGIVTNTSEVAETYNEYGVTDINSTPGNKKADENDIGKAEVIISISTGGQIALILLVVAVLSIITGGVIIIKKKVLEERR